LEKGFGDSPESVYETIMAAAATGLAGCSIEDHTGRPEVPIFDKALAVERIDAAVEACRALPHDFVLTARCENLLWGRPDLDDVIGRLQAYEAAGADVLYAPALPDLDAIRKVCSALNNPVNVIMDTPGATFGVDELSAAGVKRISVGSAFAQLAYGSLVSAAREIAQNGSFDFTKTAMDYFELAALFTPVTDTHKDFT
ncbi:MAG: isocitrate lyase/PEP mutase family protein, partial [Hyphomicrobiales bacterium]